MSRTQVITTPLRGETAGGEFGGAIIELFCNLGIWSRDYRPVPQRQEAVLIQMLREQLSA
ncbi:hypothetical protein ABID21_004812 [Pseudorhizobium tarimense]|uniref:Uncharacterized protein n=1 Tax=Pseudorhizobium tarimense TaxID=1079109 RepID=A0ABV2HDQ2_9HYPH|nr:hypothetical protein [Pseudorhizobium tarimense]MCJ8521001.1 hypothetical protein [Pseudorhizobium tarimense]MCJ8521018.1 hypothetical protein [Pseudorhizobium tarimense]